RRVSGGVVMTSTTTSGQPNYCVSLGTREALTSPIVPTNTSTLCPKAVMRTASNSRWSGCAGTISIEALRDGRSSCGPISRPRVATRSAGSRAGETQREYETGEFRETRFLFRHLFHCLLPATGPGRLMVPGRGTWDKGRPKYLVTPFDDMVRA